MDTKTFLCFLFTVQSSVVIQAKLSEYCQDSELRCQDGICVDFHFSCDTDAECLRVSDMRVSRVPSSNVRTPFRSLCKKNEFDCFTGRCVPLTWLCDTAEDCENGFDERDCLPIPNNCPADLVQPYRRMFKIYNIKNVTLSCKTCISSGQMNDPLKLAIYPTKSVIYVNVGETVVLQCRDEGALRTPVRWLREGNKPFTVGTYVQPRGRLEMNIAVPADSGGYICQAPLYSGSPGSEARIDIVVGSSDPDIRKRRFLDMEQECYENQFQCVSDKVCFPLKWRCDGDVDCYDGSDEQNCFVQSSN